MASETQIAWLAGAIEGDGSIGMGFHFQPNRMDCVAKPTLTFSNQDERLVEEVAHLFEEISGKRPQVRAGPSGYEGGRPTITVTLIGMRELAITLAVLRPYFVGEKHGKADLIIRFAVSRLNARPREKGQGPPRYSAEDLRTMLEFHRTGARKGGRRNPAVQVALERRLQAVS